MKFSDKNNLFPKTRYFGILKSKIFLIISLIFITVGLGSISYCQSLFTNITRNFLPNTTHVSAATQTTANLINITPSNVADYFTVHGSGNYPFDNGTPWQATIGQGDGLITLTQDSQWLTGNVTLNTKINLNQDFNLKGSANLGDKDKSQGGADGIGFVFQPGNTEVVGKSGQWLGMGGLKNAFGFKLDTYYNDYPTYPAEDGTEGSFDPDIILDSSGNNVVGKLDMSKIVFGNFTSTNSSGVMTNRSTPGGTPALVVPSPKNDTLVPFEIDYTALTHTLSIKYNGITWSEDISSYTPEDGNVSFSITASTGGNWNKQQVKIDSFTYTEATGTVHVNYIDQNGDPIFPSETLKGNLYESYTTNPKPDILGKYKLVATQGTTNGIYTANDQTVTYIYNVAYQVSSPHIVTENIDYVDENDATLAPSVSQKMTFVTVTNLATGNKITYFKMGEQEQPQIDGSGKLDSSWTIGNGMFSAVTNPIITNYHVISTTDLTNDLTQITSQMVGWNSSDLNFTVIYDKNSGKIIIRAVDINGKAIAGYVPITKVGYIDDKYSTDAPNIIGYKLIESPKNKSGIYTKDIQDVEYVYAVDYHIDIKHINETIHYVEKSYGIPVTPDYNANITFMIITNLSTNQKTIYYKNGYHEKPLLNDGKPDSSWIEKDSGSFIAVRNPIINNYKVFSKTDNDNDLTQIIEKIIYPSSNNIEITVFYEKQTQITPIIQKTIGNPPISKKTQTLKNKRSQIIHKELLPTLGENKKITIMIVGVLLLTITSIKIIVGRRK